MSFIGPYDFMNIIIRGFRFIIGYTGFIIDNENMHTVRFSRTKLIVLCITIDLTIANYEFIVC